MKSNSHFIAIGPPKTATSWLYKTLMQHPDVFLPPDKEIRYFWAREFLGKANVTNKLFGNHWHYKGKRSYLKQRIKYHFSNMLHGKADFHAIYWDFRYIFYTESDQWYIDLFDKDKLSGDITPKYCEVPEKVIIKIRSLFPDAKIIISLRYPVDREWSRAKMNLMKKKRLADYKNVDAHRFKKHFMNELQHKSNDYVDLVKRWKKYFPEENILVFFYEELLDDPQALLRKVCNFLGIELIDFKQPAKKFNEGVQQKIPEILEQQLIDLNYPFIAKMPEYFESQYPLQWLRKCDQSRQRADKEAGSNSRTDVKKV